MEKLGEIGLKTPGMTPEVTLMTPEPIRKIAVSPNTGMYFRMRSSFSRKDLSARRFSGPALRYFSALTWQC